MPAAKIHHYQELYDQLDTLEGANNIYCLGKSHHCFTQDIGYVMQVKGPDNQVLRDLSSILRWWLEYFSSICNEEFQH